VRGARYHPLPQGVQRACAGSLDLELDAGHGRRLTYINTPAPPETHTFPCERATRIESGSQGNS
jgi:hypothetical protein